MPPGVLQGLLGEKVGDHLKIDWSPVALVVLVVPVVLAVLVVRPTSVALVVLVACVLIVHASELVRGLCSLHCHS